MQHLPFQHNLVQHGSPEAHEPPVSRHEPHMLPSGFRRQIPLQHPLSALQLLPFDRHPGVVVVEVVLVEVEVVLVEVVVLVVLIEVVVVFSHGPRWSPWPRWPSTAL